MPNLRTQDEILANWGGKTDPVVSVSCITYNHEPYIRDAIEGFLIQETDFPFEVLIYDDASTDKTADIIREFEALYPAIIIPIYQTENQYSKGVSVSCVYNFSRARGDYIALCEGDDYWICAEKLHLQVKVFLADLDCSMVFHPAHYITGTSKEFLREVGRYRANAIFDIERILERGGGFYPTASAMLRRSVLTGQRPEWAKGYRPGDFALGILAAYYGRILYIDRTMSVYRWHADSVNHGEGYKTLSRSLNRFKKDIQLVNWLRHNRPDVPTLRFELSSLYKLASLKAKVSDSLLFVRSISPSRWPLVVAVFLLKRIYYRITGKVPAIRITTSSNLE